MSTANTVKARWVAGYHAELPNGTQLIPGETVVDVPAGEARDSDNWKPVERKPAKRKPAKPSAAPAAAPATAAATAAAPTTDEKTE